jgi:hypothetical protein
VVPPQPGAAGAESTRPTSEPAPPPTGRASSVGATNDWVSTTPPQRPGAQPVAPTRYQLPHLRRAGGSLGLVPDVARLSTISRCARLRCLARLVPRPRSAPASPRTSSFPTLDRRVEDDVRPSAHPEPDPYCQSVSYCASGRCPARQPLRPFSCQLVLTANAGCRRRQPLQSDRRGGNSRRSGLLDCRR